MNLQAMRVTTLFEAQIVRMIRNATSGTYTEANMYIDDIQQKEFFHPELKLWLYVDHETIAPVGFGFLTIRNGKLFATLGVLPEFQSLGAGQIIYKHLYEVAEQDLYLEIFGDNRPSLVAAMKAGFDIIPGSINDKTILLIRKK
jgi:GNAT superfamily N-acetyltransferase